VLRALRPFRVRASDFYGDDLASGKKGWLGIAPSQPLNLTPTLRFSSGSNNAYNACELDGSYNSTAVQCSKTFGKMDNRRSSCSSCAGNTHTHIPGIRSSRNDIQDNRSRPRLLPSRLKPERQLVLLEPEPVQSLPMEVKEVFSRILLFLNFPVCLCVCSGTEAPGTELTAHMKIAPLPFLSDSNTDNVAVPVEDKNPKKIGLVG
jgi:hypothetical protein